MEKVKIKGCQGPDGSGFMACKDCKYDIDNESCTLIRLEFGLEIIEE